jgi:hypothetical protein
MKHIRYAMLLGYARVSKGEKQATRIQETAFHAAIGYLAFPVCLWHNGCNADCADGPRAYICRG